MIKEVTMYTVVCDSCGKDLLKNEEYSAWNDARYVEDIAIEDNWSKQDDNHYCPDCYEYDDDDNLIVNPKKITHATNP